LQAIVDDIQPDGRVGAPAPSTRWPVSHARICDGEVTGGVAAVYVSRVARRCDLRAKAGQ